MILKNQGGFTRHTGVLLSLIILLILLVWNWNTCFAPSGESIYTRITNWIMGPIKRDTVKEGFTGDDVKALAAGIDESKLEVKVRPEDKAVDVMFKGISAGSALTSGSNVKGYLLVLAKYDKDLNQVGALNVKISDEGGSTFGEQLVAFTGKYTGILSSSQVTNINKLTSGSSLSDIATAFGGAELLAGNTQLTDIYIKLLDLLYTYKRNMNENLNTVYNHISLSEVTTCDASTPNCKLPSPENTEDTAKTNGIDYLYLTSDTTKPYTNEIAKAEAAVLKRALTDYPAIRNYFRDNKYYYVTKLRDLMNRIIDLYSNPVAAPANKMCDADGLCKYTFTELDPVDPQGAPYNYKLGVGVLIVDSAGLDKVSKIDAYTYGGAKRLEFFKLTNTLEEQTKLVRRLDMVDRNQLAAASAAPTPTQALPGAATGSVGGDMDAYMKMLRPYLGDYPNEFQMSKAQMDDVSLSKYLQESLALGQVNVNIGISDLAGATTPTATAAAGTVDFN